MNMDYEKKTNFGIKKNKIKRWYIKHILKL